ncbi:MAG: hypothetical protein ABJL55_02215 [Roseibium sp.]
MTKIDNHRTMNQLVKDLMKARHGRRDFLEHPSVVEIHSRLPEDLLAWFARVVILNRDPLTIHCVPTHKSDHAYFEIWRYMRDRDYPVPDMDESNNDPEGGGNGSSDGSSCAPPKNSL